MELGSFSLSSLAAPPRSFQEHVPSLASLPSDPTQSYPPSSQSRPNYHNAVDRSQAVANIVDEYKPPTYPSLLQQAALTVLQDFENEVVLAWLTQLRSVRLGSNHWFQHTSLSSQQVEAIFVLRNCPDGLVSAWLDLTRGDGAFNEVKCLFNSSRLDTQRASAPLLHSSWQGSSSTSRSSAGSLGALPTLYDGNTGSTTPTSSCSRGTFLDLSAEASIDETTQSVAISHDHWCFICEDPRVITTCDGWKRHMKEHETRYRCMPRGPIEYSADGASCAFCGLRDPNENHCDAHKAFPCANRSLDVRSYTRKPHLISHIKTHHVTDNAELANRWRDTVDKKHFSCGFCISHFHSLIEQLNHVDVVHYRLFQHVRDWDSNNVIRGLLLQPGVDESWQHILASHPDLIETLLRWNLSVIKNLQLRLELSDESADTLAEVAFNERTYDWRPHNEVEVDDTAGLSSHGDGTTPQQHTVSQTVGPVQYNSSESSVLDEDMMTSSALHTERSGWPWVVQNHSISHENDFLGRGDSEVTDGGVRMEIQHPYSNNSHSFIEKGGNHRIQPPTNSFCPWISSRTPDSDLSARNRVMAGDCWQAAPILNPTNSSSLVSSQPINPNHHGMDKVRAKLATQPPATAPCHMPSSATKAPNPFVRPNPVIDPTKRPSRSKLKDYYDIDTEADMDLDLDILQRLMRDEESTRSERRSR